MKAIDRHPDERVYTLYEHYLYRAFLRFLILEEIINEKRFMKFIEIEMDAWKKGNIKAEYEEKIHEGVLSRLSNFFDDLKKTDYSGLQEIL